MARVTVSRQWGEGDILRVCDCGWPVGSFACKIRHLHLNTGDAKAAND